VSITIPDSVAAARAQAERINANLNWERVHDGKVATGDGRQIALQLFSRKTLRRLPFGETAIAQPPCKASKSSKFIYIMS